MTRLQFGLLMGVLLALSACQGPRPTTLPRGTAAYSVAPAAPAAVQEPTARALRPGDTIAVRVYREPELSSDKLLIDDLGTVQLPLLGEVNAAGHTPAEFSRLLTQQLGGRYLRDPRVTVALLGTTAQTVTIEGQVNGPGVFAVSPSETLLTSLARAGSPTPTAKLDEVVVFRTVNGQRLGAVFDLRQIRAGNAADPQIIDGDVVVVGFSQVKGAFRDFLSVAPLINLFTVF